MAGGWFRTASVIDVRETDFRPLHIELGTMTCGGLRA
jgi:hypothetical protein